MNTTSEITQIALFKGKKIRKTLFNGEWWFSVVDVVEALTDSTRASAYWTAMKVRVEEETGFQLSTICRQLKLESSDGKKYETDCSDTEGMFRIIQSIPSPNMTPKYPLEYDKTLGVKDFTALNTIGRQYVSENEESGQKTIETITTVFKNGQDFYMFNSSIASQDYQNKILSTLYFQIHKFTN